MSSGGLFLRWFGKVRPRRLFDDNGDEMHVEESAIHQPEIEKMINLDTITEENSVTNTAASTNGGTPGTNATGSTLGASVTRDDNYESLLAQRNELLRQREEMKKRFAESIQGDKSKKYDGNTIRLGGRRPVYQGKDATNYVRVVNLAAMVFRYQKLLPQDWHVYTTVGNTICDRIMKCGLDMPYEFTPAFYFNNVLRKMFIAKFRSLKTNFTTVCRELYVSKLICTISV